MFEELYVIHCKRLPSRREYLQPILRDLGWEAKWIESNDPGEIPRRHLLRFQSGVPMLTVAEISVYLKHLEAFRHIGGHEEARGFVIEDDAVFPADFAATFDLYRSSLNVPFDLVFFGACAAVVEPPAEGGPRFVEQHRTRSMSGYLITSSAARRLLAALAGQPILQPIDHAVTRILREGGYNVLWSQPPLILNGSETGRFRHSLGVPWREGRDQPRLFSRVQRVMDRLVAAISVRR